MHMADALVSPQVGAIMVVASGSVVAYSIRQLKKEEDFKEKIPTMGVMGAFVFATQMINFTIPGTGSSGHLCGGLLLSSLLGPYAGFLSMVGILFIQCLFFADGGLLALGANCWNMAFYGCFLGSLIWKYVMKNGFSKRKIILASVLGSVLTLQLGAFSVVLETTFSQITALPFLSFLMVMQPIHLIIGFIEGLITAAVLCFVYEARPELLWSFHDKDRTNNKLSYRKVLMILIVAVFIIGGVVSLFASQYPDGLEWSIAQLTDLNIQGSYLSELLSTFQQSISLLPDYAFKNNDGAIGTSVSGIVGCLITIILLYGVGYLIKNNQKKEKNDK